MVARVNVCFTAEDPVIFARRHIDAHASRARAESLLRYNLFLDSMPTEDIQPLSTEQVKGVWEICRLNHTSELVPVL